MSGLVGTVSTPLLDITLLQVIHVQLDNAMSRLCDAAFVAHASRSNSPSNAWCIADVKFRIGESQ